MLGQHANDASAPRSPLTRVLSDLRRAGRPIQDDLLTMVRSSEVLLPRSEAGQVPLLTNDSGERLLPLFSELATLARWAKPGTPFGAMPGSDALAMALALGVDAVVIDPAGPVRLEFARADIVRLRDE